MMCMDCNRVIEECVCSPFGGQRSLRENSATQISDCSDPFERQSAVAEPPNWNKADHHASCKPSDSSLVWQCVQCGHVVAADDIAARLRAAESENARLAGEVDQARTVCAQVYQVVGALASFAGVFETDDIVRVLDNLGNAANGETPPHDLLPWPQDTKPFQALEAERERASSLARELEGVRARTIDECWNAVNALIKTGPLPDVESEQRNGLVLATNVIRALDRAREGNQMTKTHTNTSEHDL